MLNALRVEIFHFDISVDIACTSE